MLCWHNPIRLRLRQTPCGDSLGRTVGALIFFIVVNCNAPVWAQSLPLFDSPSSARADPADALSTHRANLGLILGYSAAVALYGKANWWDQGFGGGFHARKEGWFGHDTYSGGADKLGHLYLNYTGTRLFAEAFQWAGNSPEKSRALAAWLMLGTFTAIEIIDGYSRQWHFSREDALMNVAGVGLALLFENQPALDRVLDFRIHYWPSGDGGFDPFGDYSGQTYLLVAKASGIAGWRDRPLLRYLELAVGYGTRGYSGSFDEPVRGERKVYVGISLNLSSLLDDKVFRDSPERQMAQRIARTTLEFVQVPGTAVFVKHSLD